MFVLKIVLMLGLICGALMLPSSVGYFIYQVSAKGATMEQALWPAFKVLLALGIPGIICLSIYGIFFAKAMRASFLGKHF